MTKLLSFLSSIGSAIGGWFNWKNSPVAQRRAAEEDIAKRDAEVKAATDEIKDAVYSADDTKLNEIVSRLMKPVLIISIALTSLVGCISKTETVYIPTDRKIESCVNSLGISCKAVPDAVMVEMLEKIQELEELRREMKIDKRVSK
ncbi:MAG: hypothetical protein J6V38_05455 [Kiritimatiellae bacterium]|nr:hypothetical protein [Kiritimatiellia bacterium]